MKKLWKRIILGAFAFTFASALVFTHARFGVSGDSASSATPYENVTGKYDFDLLREKQFNDAVVFADAVPLSPV